MDGRYTDIKDEANEKVGGGQTLHMNLSNGGD